MAVALEERCRHDFCVHTVQQELELINADVPEEQLDKFEKSRMLAQIGQSILSRQNLPCKCDQPVTLKDKLLELYETVINNQLLAQKMCAVFFSFSRLQSEVASSTSSILSKNIGETAIFLKKELDVILEEGLNVKHGMNNGNQALLNLLQTEVVNILYRSEILEPVQDCYGNAVSVPPMQTGILEV